MMLVATNYWLAAVLASESPNDSEGMRAVYDVIQTRADYEFKELPAGDIRAQITAKGQFSGYNKFKNTAPFIEYYSGIRSIIQMILITCR